MVKTQRKMSDVMIEMSGRLLRDPDGTVSAEAQHISLMFANIAWNESIGLLHGREGYRPGWEVIEASDPTMWSEFKSNDVDAMIDELVEYKKKHYPDDMRRIVSCGIPNGNVRVEWLAPAKPGVDSQMEMLLYGLVRSRQRKEAIRYLRDVQKMPRKAAELKVASVEAEFARL